MKRKNVESNKFEAIVTGFSREDAVRIALYYVENIASTEKHIEIIKMWLKNKNSITKKELEIAKFELKFEYPIYNLTFCNTNLIKYYLRTVLESSVGMNLHPTFEHVRLYAYEDLSFPYKNISKTFNLDNPTDLNIFLDFLTDNYPTAITYDREEYFKNKLAKEYLKAIYQ